MIRTVRKNIAELIKQWNGPSPNEPAERIEMQCTGNAISEIWVALLESIAKHILNVGQI